MRPGDRTRRIPPATRTQDRPPYVDDESETVSLGDFEFESGATLPLDVAYRTYGEYDGDNAVLVCHALTGSQHVAAEGDTDQARGWWSEVVGPGGYVDTDEYYVICANVPGSCYGATGPASEGPNGDPYGSDFPEVTVGDWTRTQARLLDHLGVDRLHAVVGGSLGGMNVLDWARRFPDRVDRVAPVATAGRLDPQVVALSAIRRRAIIADPEFADGDYYPDHPDGGLELARRLGHVLYLSKDSMDRRFGRTRTDGEWDVVNYLDYNAGRFVDRFDANSYLLLSRAMERFDLSRGYADDADALDGFDGEALVVSVTGDWHFTTDQADGLSEAFRRAGADATHYVLDSDYGHDAFLTEPDRIGPVLTAFLDGGVGAETGDATPEASKI